MRIKSAVFSFSLLLATLGLGQSFTHLKADAAQKDRAGQIVQVVRAEGVPIDQSLESLLAKAEAHPNSEGLRKELIDALGLRADLEAAPANDAAAPAIKRIQANPLYRNVNERRSSNWVGDTMVKIGKLFPKFKQPKIENPDLKAFSGADVVIRIIAWLILGGLLLTFLIFASRYWSFRRSLQRRASAVLEDEEPERTLDEWLAMADALEREGRFREAIRCLYLACLLRFDEAGVARFVRSHTNWEHLSRIQESPKNPGIDFLPLTRAFDLAWYGFRVKGPEDVVAFRLGYQEITKTLRGLA